MVCSLFFCSGPYPPRDANVVYFVLKSKIFSDKLPQTDSQTPSTGILPSSFFAFCGKNNSKMLLKIYFFVFSHSLSKRKQIFHFYNEFY